MNDFLKEVRPLAVLITDLSFVIESMSFTAQSTFAKLIETGAKVGVYFVIGAAYGAIERLYDDITTVVKKQKVGVLIGRITDQTILEVVNRPYREQNLLLYEAYYIKHGNAEKIKIVAPKQKREEWNTVFNIFGGTATEIKRDKYSKSCMTNWWKQY